jgi:hypothetical protein
MECQLYDKDAGEDERLGMYVLTEKVKIHSKSRADAAQTKKNHKNLSSLRERRQIFKEDKFTTRCQLNELVN